ncbi:MAG: hypothetical protein V4754_07135 [Pseudomonadota bacterium]
MIARRGQLLVALGGARLTCGIWDGAGWREGSVRGVDLDGADSLSAMLAQLAVLLQDAHQAWSAPPSEMGVVVAEQWLAVAGMPWSDGVARAGRAAAHARAELIEAGFAIEPADTVKLDDAPHGAPRLAVAYPAALLLALEQQAATLQLRLVSVLPLALAAWAQVRRQPGPAPRALALRDRRHMVLARSAGAGQSYLSDLTVRLHACPPAQADVALAQLWQRLCLRDPLLADDAQVPLYDLDATPGAPPPAPFCVPASKAVLSADVEPSLQLALRASTLRSSVDAMAARPRRSAPRMVAVAAVLLLAVLVVDQANIARQRVRELGARLEAGRPKAAAPARALVWNAEEAARVRAVNGAIGELNLPLAPIMRALEPPRDLQVALLSMETAGAAGGKSASVKISAEARSSAEMARYVAYVAGRKPFVAAYLLGHEIDESAVERPYRFTLEAVWHD